jgi:hypothetical protein
LLQPACVLKQVISVRLSLSRVVPTAHRAPLTCALIGGAQPVMVGGPLSPALLREVGAGGSRYEVHLRCRTPHRHTKSDLGLALSRREAPPPPPLIHSIRRRHHVGVRRFDLEGRRYSSLSLRSSSVSNSIASTCIRSSVVVGYSNNQQSSVTNHARSDIFSVQYATWLYRRPTPWPARLPRWRESLDLRIPCVRV